VSKSDEEILHTGPHSEIIFADGTKAQSSFDELFERADFLASIYGMGGCKSLTEYINMVDQEDPIMVAGLISAASKRIKEMYSTDGNKTTIKSSNKCVGMKNGKAEVVDGFDSMLGFLSQMGATDEEVAELRKQKKEGKIKPVDTDYSWITSEEISKPDFPIKDVLRQIAKDREKCVNVDVSEDKRQAKLRRSREKHG
jgi:hypothetical protein